LGIFWQSKEPIWQTCERFGNPSNCSDKKVKFLRSSRRKPICRTLLQCKSNLERQNTPQQNGVVERRLTDRFKEPMHRCAANFDDDARNLLWAEAVNQQQMIWKT
jgi:hypothetical protein